MKTKISYGIALCRYNKTDPEKNNNVEVVMIKKRYTYQYQSFVMAHYDIKHTKYIRYLFNNMTFSEKIDILSMEFSAMWRRIWLNNPERFFNLVEIYKNNNKYDKNNSHVIKNKFSDIEIHKTYYEKKNKFENYFQRDNGMLLRNLIYQSNNAELLWEIPKGRKDETNLEETNIDCAIREFYEETSISSDKYKILYNYEPIIDSFIDNQTHYKTIYYVAKLHEEYENYIPYIDFKNFDQITEIEQIKWVSISEIKFFNLHKTVQNRLYNLFKKIIKVYKKSNKITMSLPPSIL